MLFQQINAFATIITNVNQTHEGVYLSPILVQVIAVENLLVQVLWGRVRSVSFLRRRGQFHY